MIGGPWASVDGVGGLYKTGLGSIRGILMVGWRLDQMFSLFLQSFRHVLIGDDPKGKATRQIKRQRMPAPKIARNYLGKLARKKSLCKKPPTHYCKSSIFQALVYKDSMYCQVVLRQLEILDVTPFPGSSDTVHFKSQIVYQQLTVTQRQQQQG